MTFDAKVVGLMVCIRNAAIVELDPGGSMRALIVKLQLGSEVSGRYPSCHQGTCAAPVSLLSLRILSLH